MIYQLKDLKQGTWVWLSTQKLDFDEVLPKQLIGVADGMVLLISGKKDNPNYARGVYTISRMADGVRDVDVPRHWLMTKEDWMFNYRYEALPSEAYMWDPEDEKKPTASIQLDTGRCMCSGPVQTKTVWMITSSFDVCCKCGKEL